MSADTSTIIIVLTIIGTGAALALAILPGLRDLRQGLQGLGERVARIEGALQNQGFNGGHRYVPGEVQTREEK